jgi:outer membrane biogenesis lipoprotein LolB
MTRFVRIVATLVLAVVVLGLAGCSGDKPPASGPKTTDEALKQEAEQQRQTNERMRHNK